MTAPTDVTAGAADFHRRTGRPLVTLTYAQSIDGSIAARRDQGLRLSGEQSQVMTHQLRAVHDAILVGIGTLLADDPHLTARLASGPNPRPVILDSRLRTPLDARLLQNPDLNPWIFAAEKVNPRRKAALEQRGASIYSIPESANGRLDLASLLTTLGSMGIKSLMVEGGAQIITSFLTGFLADWLVVTIAPVFVGGVHAVEAVAQEGQTRFPDLGHVHSRQLGQDVVLWGDLEPGRQ